MDLDSSGLFNSARRMLVLAAHTEGTAERLGSHNLAHIVFKRAAEFQYELVDAVEQLLLAGRVRSALASLRTMLEVTASFSWLSCDFAGRLEQLTIGRCPGAQRMMSSANLGWEDEYKKSYSRLSDFVHGSFVLADFNKTETVYEDTHAAPYSVLGDYFMADVDGKPTIRLIEEKPAEELIAAHGDFIAAKTFDLVLVMLLRASGPYADSFNWWPQNSEIEAFDELVRSTPTEINFLWSSEKKNLAVFRVEGKYA